MILRTLTIPVFFFTAIVKTQNQSLLSTLIENLEDEYYTTQTVTSQVLPQDHTDAQAIVDSKKDETVIASIFSSREKIRRYAINEQTTALSEDKKTPWINDRFIPQDETVKPFTDLCFGLMKDEATVLGNYLSNFMRNEQHDWINIGMVLTKDIQNMIATYDNHFKKDAFKTLRKKQLYPYENMLRIWVRQNREPLEKDELNHNYVLKDAHDLKSELDDGGWYEHRDVIETILMKKSIKYARAVIQEFEKINDGRLIEDIINDATHKYKALDGELGDAYVSLARYIKNKYSYIADLLCKCSDGRDHWAAWIMCIAVVHPCEWEKVDAEFKKRQTNDSLSKFILRKMTDDAVTAELIATIVDSSFQPTKFAKKPPAPQASPTAQTPPPVSPTTLAT